MNMFINVLPINISFWDEILTYFVKKEQSKFLQVWSIVTIPIRNNIHRWIVIGFASQLPNLDFEIKSIIDVVCSFPIISKYQIWLIFALNNKYFYSLNKVVNLFFPNYIWNRLDKNSFLDIANINYSNQKQGEIKKKPTLIHNISNLKYDEILEKSFDNLDDCVLIFWDDYSIDSFMEKNSKKFDAIIYKNSMTYSKKYKVYLQVLSKEKNIIIWTRKILQYNLSAYKKIIFIEDSIVKNNYNQLEKYKNLDIIKFIYLQKQFEIYFVSNIPSIDLFYMSKIEKFEYKTI